MFRYHFSVRDGIDLGDLPCAELETPEQAKAEGVRYLGKLLEVYDAGIDLEDLVLDVSDDVGALLFSMSITVTPSATA